MLISVSDLLALIPISRVTLYARMQDPDFPQPVKIGRRIFWKSEEIQQYIESKQVVRGA